MHCTGFYFCTSNPLANPSLARFPCVVLQGKVQELALILTRQQKYSGSLQDQLLSTGSSPGPGNKPEQSRLVLTCDIQLGPPRDHWPAEIWHLHETLPHPSLTHPPNMPSPWSPTVVWVCWQCSKGYLDKHKGQAEGSGINTFCYFRDPAWGVEGSHGLFHRQTSLWRFASRKRLGKLLSLEHLAEFWLNELNFWSAVLR